MKDSRKLIQEVETNLNQLEGLLLQEQEKRREGAQASPGGDPSCRIQGDPKQDAGGRKSHEWATDLRSQIGAATPRSNHGPPSKSKPESRNQPARATFKGRPISQYDSDDRKPVIDEWPGLRQTSTHWQTTLFRIITVALFLAGLIVGWVGYIHSPQELPSSQKINSVPSKANPDLDSPPKSKPPEDAFLSNSQVQSFSGSLEQGTSGKPASETVTETSQGSQWSSKSQSSGKEAPETLFPPKDQSLSKHQMTQAEPKPPAGRLTSSALPVTGKDPGKYDASGRVNNEAVQSVLQTPQLARAGQVIEAPPGPAATPSSVKLDHNTQPKEVGTQLPINPPEPRQPEPISPELVDEIRSHIRSRDFTQARSLLSQLPPPINWRLS